MTYLFIYSSLGNHNWDKATTNGKRVCRIKKLHKQKLSLLRTTINA